MKSVIVILGPTASGKSALAVHLARRFGGEVVSADSRQLYRGMDLGTGKITKKEMRGIPHHLLDVASPKRRWTVARYERAATRAIGAASGPVWLVGGSPFYIQAALHPGRFPNVPPNPRLRKRLQDLPVEKLFERLLRLDPVRAAEIERKNPVRLIRAIEIATGLGHVPTLNNTASPYRILKIGLHIPASTLRSRIRLRLSKRMNQGMAREVQRLHRNGLSWDALDSFGLEYRYLAKILRGELTRPEGFRQLESAIVDFSRRQMTWWKRDEAIHWIRARNQAVPLVRSFLALQ